MQIHGPSESPDGIAVRLNPGTRARFAVVDFGSTEIFVESVADADELIKAAVRAKDLLLGAPETPERCGQTRPLGDEPCALPPGHGGWHMDARGNEWPKFAEDPTLDAILNGPGHQAPAGTDAS